MVVHQVHPWLPGTGRGFISVYLCCSSVASPLSVPDGSDMHSFSVIACDSIDGVCSSHDCNTSAFASYSKPVSVVNSHCVTQNADWHREKQEINCGVYCGPFYLSAASGLSTPPTTPTQSSSQPVFTQEAQTSRPSPERLEASSRSRSLSTPPDTGQRLCLPSAKPPIPSSNPMPSYSTSQQVSPIAKMFKKPFKVECNLF